MKRLSLFAIAIAIVALSLAACDSEPTNPSGPSVIGPIVFTAQLSAANEVPAVSNAESAARGGVTITMTVPRDANGNVIGGGTVSFAMQIAGFPLGTAAILAHIHSAPAGTNGPIVVDTRLSPAAPIVMGDGTAALSIASADITVSQALATQIVANPANYYFNVHTPLNPGGAIRGQLVRN